MASGQENEVESSEILKGQQDEEQEQLKPVHKNGVPETDVDSGVDENTQQGDGSPKTGSGGTTASRIPRKTPPESPVKNRSRRPRPAGTPNFPRSKSVPKPFTGVFSIPPSTAESFSAPKKVSMNKIVVGTTASPNLKQVRSKIGSLDNAAYKPGGGEVKIESRKLEWKTTARTSNFNDGYTPKGGDKKFEIESRKLEWNAAPRIGSLENAKHKPGGGDKSIQVQKLDWKANSKVGSTDNIKHKPGGGNVKIIEHKIDLKVESKIGSLANIKHKPGGGDKKVFNDVEYLRQTSSTLHSNNISRTGSRRESATQLFAPLVNGGLRLRRHSIGQIMGTDHYFASAEKRRNHYGSFGGLTDSVHPLCFVLSQESGDKEPSVGFNPFSRQRIPPPPPPPPPASRNENLVGNGFGKTMTVIECN